MGVLYSRTPFFNMLDRILAGENFSIIERSKAEMYAEEQYEKAYMQGCYTQSEMECIIEENSVFTSEDDQLLKNILSQIDQFKVEYFDNWGTPKAKKIKFAIEQLESRRRS